MKIRLIFFLFATTYFHLLNAQDYQIIHANNCEARAEARMQTLWDPVYSACFCDGIDVLSTLAPWITGNYNNGGVTSVYSSSINQSIFRYGPISSNQYFAQVSAQWNHVWKITKSEIDQHRNQFQSPGYVVPLSIAEWPANGDVSKGQAFYIAPYVDVNQNGIYDPASGDYPDIRGDEASFFVFNNTIYAGQSDNFEIHVMVYQYNCSDYNILNNTTFIHYRFFNRSLHDLNNAYVGISADLNAGGNEDDYIGFDLSHGTMYAYNADNYDESFNGYTSNSGNYPIYSGLCFLAGPKADNDNVDNPISSNWSVIQAQNGIPYNGLGKGYGDGIIDNERLGARFGHHYNLMVPEPDNGLKVNMYSKGINSLNQPFTENDSSALQACRFSFPGTSDPSNYNTYGNPPMYPNWTNTSQYNTPNDVSGFISSGPFTLEAGGNAEMDIAIVYGKNIQAGNITGGWPAFQQTLSGLHLAFEMNVTPCGEQIMGEKEIQQDLITGISPNPCTTQFELAITGDGIFQIEIYNSNGEKVDAFSRKEGKHLVNTSNYAPGIYMIKIMNNSMFSYQKLLVVP